MKTMKTVADDVSKCKYDNNNNENNGGKTNKQ
jgi:hypothetical protein